MKRTPVTVNPADFPEEFHSLLAQSRVYDSSCSREARVFFLDKGFYLKTAAPGALKTEAEMTRYFYDKGLGAEVLAYLPREQDWLLTRAVPGEDCTHYTHDPKRLCDTLAQLLRQLHETDVTGCPVTDRCGANYHRAEANRRRGFCDLALFPEGWSFASPEEAWTEVTANGSLLKNEVLLHGDYCLPNILLKDWKFSGFIDLDSSGIGDRHIDLFWAVWTLNYNLKTNAYYDRFLDVYGRDVLIPEKLRTVAAFEVFG